MKQLRHFISRLTQSGYTCEELLRLTNPPEVALLYKIARDGREVEVIFRPLGGKEDHGFEMYLQAEGSDLHESEFEILKALQDAR